MPSRVGGEEKPRIIGRHIFILVTRVPLRLINHQSLFSSVCYSTNTASASEASILTLIRFSIFFRNIGPGGAAYLKNFLRVVSFPFEF